LRVLIAADDTANRQLGLRIVEQLGHSGQAAASAAQTLSALEAQHYDIVLLDVQLPDLDGLSVARGIRQRWPADQQPYLIAVTANAWPGAREECLSAGMNDYLVKPLQIEALRAAIGRYYDHRPAQQNVYTLAKAMGQPQRRDEDTRIGDLAIDAAIPEEMRALLGDQQPQRVDDLIDCYYADSAALLQSMHDAIAQGDVHVLERAAHQLKASSAVVGATALADLCNLFEQAVSMADPEEWREWVQRIEGELAHVKLTLDQKRKRIDE
jgi:CheY-like chemotaxis protein/HPt (histidine-containing phosphotransfer) domain-containing protein